MQEARILVTGGSGFVGRHLVRALRTRPNPPTVWSTVHDLEHRVYGDELHLNIADEQSVDEVVRAVRPTTIVHLAAITTVQASYQEEGLTWRVNALGTLNTLLAIRRHSPSCHFILASSAEVYGKSPLNSDPFREDSILRPDNPYAVSKAAADLMVQEATSRSLFATIVRPFNHTGPGQAAEFVVPAFCSQIARIERGLQEPVLHVGDLQSERDFMDVEDIVSLYIKIIERRLALPNGAVLNAASGKARKIADILRTLLQLSEKTIEVEIDATRLRSSTTTSVVGSPQRANALLNWSPAKPFEATLAETLTFWRQNTRSE